MNRISPGIAIIAIWFVLAPLLAPCSAIFYLSRNGLDWSMPSGEELMAHINGNTSTAYAIAAERASARAQASWHPLSIIVYYFVPSLRGLAFLTGGVGYFYGGLGLLSFVLSVSCGISIWKRRTWGRYVAILLCAANLVLVPAKNLPELPLTPPLPWPLILVSCSIYLLMLWHLTRPNVAAKFYSKSKPDSITRLNLTNG